MYIVQKTADEILSRNKGLRLNLNDDDQGIVDVSESSGLNNVFEIQNRLSEILAAAFFSLSLSLSLSLQSRAERLHKAP